MFKREQVVKKIVLMLAVFTVFGCKAKNDTAKTAFSTLPIIESEERILERSSDVRRYNYNGGNGTFIEQHTENNLRKIVRKYEAKFDAYPSSLNKPAFQMHVEPDSASPIVAQLHDGDKFESFMIMNIFNSATEKEQNWLYVSSANGNYGWIELRITQDPYRDGEWSIIETVSTGDKKWTIRKYNGAVAFSEKMNVRDNPGAVGTNVIFQIDPPTGYDYYDFSKVTEEKDAIEEGNRNHWVYINDKATGKNGWVFAGYGSIDRGGAIVEPPNWDVELSLRSFR
ncbi:MAG: hypothetical protein Ta2A_09950 [Treponemataceae bacterium]|nr:MAG: hypothetical protein Ta2A_09950 [Treponemataceae bacterium]